MCGICGIAGPGIVIRDLNIFNDLLWVSAIRGHHSTGVFGYRPSAQSKRKYTLTKRVQSGPSFVIQDQNSKIDHRAVDSVMNYLLMGHCRYATVGNINLENAHPFDTGRYVGTHNGTLVDDRYRGKKETDSLLMFRDMEKKGVEPVLSDLEHKSAYSIAMFDKHKKELLIASNGERPLYFAVNEKREVLYYASELEALEFVAARNDVSMNFFSLPENEIIHIPVHDIKSGENEFNFTEVVRKEKPSVSEEKKYNWDLMDWDQDVVPHSLVDDLLRPPTNKVLEGFCSTCGTILYGKNLEQANAYKFDGKNYYTCTACLGDNVNEVAVG